MDGQKNINEIKNIYIKHNNKRCHDIKTMHLLCFGYIYHCTFLFLFGVLFFYNFCHCCCWFMLVIYLYCDSNVCFGLWAICRFHVLCGKVVLWETSLDSLPLQAMLRSTSEAFISEIRCNSFYTWLRWSQNSSFQNKHFCTKMRIATSCLQHDAASCYWRLFSQHVPEKANTHNSII